MRPGKSSGVAPPAGERALARQKTDRPLGGIDLAASVVGVDGCKGGWLAVVRDTGRGAFTFEIFPTWKALLDTLIAAPCIAVDMPIGLVTSGRRPCDTLARKRLGRGRAASVFAPPRRPMLAFSTYDQANSWGKSAPGGDSSGGGLSKQAWNITPKIRDIDSAITPADQSRIIEAHPELVFQYLNGGVCPKRKRSAAGFEQRLDLLSARGFDGLAAAIHNVDPKQAAGDDLLDACALAIAAQRKVQGTAVRLCGDPLRDDRGRKMEIWY